MIDQTKIVNKMNLKTTLKLMEILWNLQRCRFCWSFDNQWEDSCGSYKTLADSSYMYERFDELDSNMFGQGDVMSTQICECNGSNSQKQLLVCDHH